MWPQMALHRNGYTHLPTKPFFKRYFQTHRSRIFGESSMLSSIQMRRRRVNVGDHLYAGGALSKLCQLPFCRTLIDISPGCHLFFFIFLDILLFQVASKFANVWKVGEKWSLLTTVFEKGGRKRNSGFAALGKLEQISLGTVCAKSLNCWQSSWKYSNWLSELYIRSQRSKEPKHPKHVFKVHKNMNNYLAALAALLLVWKIFQYFLFYFLRYCLRAKLIWSILYF